MRRLFVMSRTGGGWAASLRMALPALLMASGALACAGARVLDPRDAAAEFLRASSQGDSEAIYAVLSPAARATLSRGDVRRLVLDQKAELEAQAQALSSPRTRVTATARLRFADGETIALDWNGGKFGVTSGGALPGGSPTPEAALDELRRVIARRSYGGLLRLLSPATRSAIEQDLRTLVGGLEHPETLPIHTSGDASSAVVPGGHHVSMRREAGTWRVEDFD